MTRDEAKKLHTKWVVWNTAYHNGIAIVSDAEFDRLTKKLLPFYPNLEKKSGAAPMAKHASARKVMLEIPMNSLDKAYDADVIKAVKDKIGSSARAVISEKVDGASLQLMNTKGKLQLFTRGKNGVGQDVSHLIPHIKGLGGCPAGEAIRFELVLPRSGAMPDSEDVARNSISGVINARTPNLKVLAKAYPVALSIMRPAAAPSKAFAKLKRLGWRIPKIQIVDRSELTVKFLNALWLSWEARAKYDIDGLVVSADVAEEPRLTNPKRGFAFKVNKKGQKTEVKEVVWQVSRYRQMKPVVFFNPIKVDGVKVGKATAHNAKYVKDNKIGPGALIEIIRSGSVIPYIVEVTRPAARPSFPKKGTYEWDETQVNILSIDEDHDDAANIRHLVNFFSTTKIEVIGFGPSVASLVSDLDPQGVAALTSKEWAERGAGPSVSSKMPEAIKAALRNTTVPKLMAASGVFGQGFGETKSGTLWELVKTHGPFKKRSTLALRLAEENGFSKASAQDVADKWGDWVGWFNALPHKPAAKSKKAITSGPMIGKVIVFTKVRDKDLAAAIEAAGGRVADRITKETTHLVYLDGEESLKTAKAEKDGVELVPYSKARRKFKL